MLDLGQEWLFLPNSVATRSPIDKDLVLKHGLADVMSTVGDIRSSHEVKVARSSSIYCLSMQGDRLTGAKI